MDNDVADIRSVIARQFESLSWNAERQANWRAFLDDFHSEAALFASARPAVAKSPSAFVERMKDLSKTSLSSFEEVVLGSEVRVFGNVAVAIAACENTENGRDINRNVEMMLLVKDGGQWKIVAQAWDKASGSLLVPEALLLARKEHG